MGFQKKAKEEKPAKPVVVEPETQAEKFEKLFALGEALDKKNKTTGSLIKLGNKVGKARPSIATGMPSLDNYVMGCGGYPRGSIIEIFGPESCGKTTSSLDVVACEQANGGIAAFVDAEHALDPNYASELGVDVGKMIVSQPDSGEQALDIVEELVKSKCVSLVVVDSVAALVPQAELDGDMGESHVGLQARLMSQACRKLTGIARANMVTLLFINQIREKIGVIYGSPEVTTGGRALKFYSTVRIDVRRRDVIKDGNDVVGHKLELKAAKNKAGSPFRTTLLDLYYPGTRFDAGFDKIGDLITYSATNGFFEQSGSWYKMDGKNIANGIDALKDLVRSDKTLLKTLRDKAKKMLTSPPDPKAVATESI